MEESIVEDGKGISRFGDVYILEGRDIVVRDFKDVVGGGEVVVGVG